jgi:hypothetical protein
VWIKLGIYHTQKRLALLVHFQAGSGFIEQTNRLRAALYLQLGNELWHLFDGYLSRRKYAQVESFHNLRNSYVHIGCCSERFFSGGYSS